MIGLEGAWERAFRSDEDDYDLHHKIKATAASLGLPTQIVRSDRALSYSDRASVMWRLAIAIYTKAGGVPWVLEDVQPRTAFIGIDYALKSKTTDGLGYVTCCAQVFDSVGSNLEFVAYNADEVRVFGKNPFLSRAQMTGVISRCLSTYQNKHSGELPLKVVVHKNTRFTEEEVSGCLGALENVESVELIQVQRSSGWHGYRLSRRETFAHYPIERGSLLPVGQHEALLWTQGDLPEVTPDRSSYFKEGKGIPKPVLITRFVGRGDFSEICRDTLALTKLDWNSDGPYKVMPATLNYAGKLAQIVKNMPNLQPHAYPVRLFM